MPYAPVQLQRGLQSASWCWQTSVPGPHSEMRDIGTYCILVLTGIFGGIRYEKAVQIAAMARISLYPLPSSCEPYTT